MTSTPFHVEGDPTAFVEILPRARSAGPDHADEDVRVVGSGFAEGEELTEHGRGPRRSCC